MLNIYIYTHKGINIYVCEYMHEILLRKSVLIYTSRQGALLKI